MSLVVGSIVTSWAKATVVPTLRCSMRTPVAVGSVTSVQPISSAGLISPPEAEVVGVTVIPASATAPTAPWLIAVEVEGSSSSVAAVQA